MTLAIDIKLSPDEALVLFEWLSAKFQADTNDIAPSAEEIALGAVLGQLESTLVEPFAANYSDLLAAARARLVNR